MDKAKIIQSLKFAFGLLNQAVEDLKKWSEISQHPIVLSEDLLKLCDPEVQMNTLKWLSMQNESLICDEYTRLTSKVLVATETQAGAVAILMNIAKSKGLAE